MGNVLNNIFWAAAAVLLLTVTITVVKGTGLMDVDAAAWPWILVIAVAIGIMIALIWAIKKVSASLTFTGSMASVLGALVISVVFLPDLIVGFEPWFRNIAWTFAVISILGSLTSKAIGYRISNFILGILFLIVASYGPASIVELRATVEEDGIVAGVTNTIAPPESDRVVEVIWERGEAYRLDTDRETGILPAEGMDFRIPVGLCIGVEMESGLPATLQGMGNEGNGSVTRVIPNPADAVRRATVRARGC